MYKVRGPPSSAVSILKFLPHSSAPGSVLLLFWPEGLGFSWGVSYFCCRSVSLNKGHPLHKEVTENKRENDRFWLHSLDHKGPFRCSSGNTTKIWGRYFSCLSCCLLFYHVVLWWVATLGKEKRKKKKNTQTTQTFPHILPFIWASYSRLLIEKRRILSEIFCCHTMQRGWLPRPGIEATLYALATES